MKNHASQGLLTRLSLAFGVAFVLALALPRQADSEPGQEAKAETGNPEDLVQAKPKVLMEGMRHLGDDHTPEWPEASAAPEGDRLKIEFQAKPNTRVFVLALDQRSIHQNWDLRINGKLISKLKRELELTRQYYELPAGSLRSGTNELAILPSDPADDITVGRIHLFEQSFRELLRLRPVRVRVLDKNTGQPMVARITLVDKQGQMPPVHYFDADKTSARPGVVYGEATGLNFEIPAGAYDIYASHGMEWSRAKAELIVPFDEKSLAPVSIELALERQVDTQGWVAADTHLHTFTYSGHGDASERERQYTLAGEGVELAIATDHNYHADYSVLRAELAFQTEYTSVIGNEVSTSNGHFNAFPFDKDSALPNQKLPLWEDLMEDIRKQGAQVVILNHPRWPAIDNSPMSIFDIEPLSGERASGGAFTFDAMELINSTLEAPDPVLVIRDWFGVLNGGERIFAAGSSDSHTVADPAGQGRTYVQVPDDRPGQVDVDQACAAMARGSMGASLGIFATIVVNSEYGAGETAEPAQSAELTQQSRPWSAKLRVAAPHYVVPTEAVLYANGVEVARQSVPTKPGEATDIVLDFELNPMPWDAHLVAIVHGEDVPEPFWPSLNPYTLALTNPVFLNMDGRPGYSSPAETARALLQNAGDTPNLQLSLGDQSVGVQMLRQVRESGNAERWQAWRKAARAAGGGLAEYVNRRSEVGQLK